jgi:hypothetical protein
MRAIVDKLSDSYAKHYSLTEHLAFDKIVLFKDTVVIQEYIPKKHKWFGNKRYKLCDSKGYMYNMTNYKLSRMQHRVVCYPMFCSVSHQTVFLRKTDTKMEKQITRL